MNGNLKQLRNPGICNPNINKVGKKSPNKLKNPNPSIIIPIIGHPYNTNPNPTKKQIPPFHRLKKNLNALCGPIINIIPIVNKIYNHDNRN